MDSVYDTAALPAVSFLIRTSTGQSSFAAHRSFSQRVTSFFGAMYQGILLCALCSLFFFRRSLLKKRSVELISFLTKILKTLGLRFASY